MYIGMLYVCARTYVYMCMYVHEYVHAYICYMGMCILDVCMCERGYVLFIVHPALGKEKFSRERACGTMTGLKNDL